MRIYDRAFSKTLSYEEEFIDGPIFHQDHLLLYEKKIKEEPEFSYFIDYDFSCDVDAWGRVATNEFSIGSVHVFCQEMGIVREHIFTDIIKSDWQAAEKISKIIDREIEHKYQRGLHLD